MYPQALPLAGSPVVYGVGIVAAAYAWTHLGQIVRMANERAPLQRHIEEHKSGDHDHRPDELGFALRFVERGIKLAIASLRCWMALQFVNPNFEDVATTQTVVLAAGLVAAVIAGVVGFRLPEVIDLTWAH